MMTKEQAEAEAAKRERHKPKSLKHMKWTAVHSSVKGWSVGLVEDTAYVEGERHKAATEKARDALRTGDVKGFMQAGSEAMMAKVRMELAETVGEKD